MCPESEKIIHSRMNELDMKFASQANKIHDKLVAEATLHVGFSISL